MVDDRDASGRFTKRYSDEDVLAAVRAHEPAATSEVAGELGIERQSADYRLRQLRDAGRVASKKIGASLVWFTTGESAAESDASAGRAGERMDPPPTPEDGLERERVPADERESAAGDRPDEDLDLSAVVAGLDLEGSGSTVEARRAALTEILEHLRAEGSATARELKALVDDDDPNLYDDADSFWSNIRRQNVFTELEIVETPGRGGRMYHYQPEGEPDS